MPIELTAEVAAQVANEAVRELVKREVRTQAENPSGWQQFLDNVGEIVCVDPFGALDPLNSFRMELEQTYQAGRVENRIEKAYERLGIASPEELNPILSQDMERVPSYQQLMRQSAEQKGQMLTMQEIIQRKIRNEA